MSPAALLKAWRTRAGELEPYAAPAAEAFRCAAEELEAALAGSLLELLTLEQAEAESGYTRGHLRRLIAEGTIPNAGTAADPAILRGQLPRKPGYYSEPVAEVASEPAQSASSRLQVAHAVVNGES